MIGAGLGGLAAACHLVGRGHDVVVVEAGDVPGGRAGRFEAGGYAFDTGPTVLTMPQLVEDCFRAAGAEMHDFLTLLAVDPMYRACFADGSELRVRHGRSAMAEEIRTVCGADEAANFERFCDWVTRLYNVEMPNFIARNYDGPAGLARPLSPAIELLRLGAFRKLATVVDHFFADDRLRRIFSFQSLYAGLAPYQALALYAVIAYMDAINGVYVPVGRHARTPGCAGRRGRKGRRRVPIQHGGGADPPRRRNSRRSPRRPARRRARARGIDRCLQR